MLSPFLVAVKVQTSNAEGKRSGRGILPNQIPYETLTPTKPRRADSTGFYKSRKRVTVKLSVSINESLPEIELAEAKFLSKEAFSIG